MAEFLERAEIVELLRVTARTVHRYTERDDFPAPKKVLAGGQRLWDRREVERWAKKTLPLQTGRPRKPSE